MYPNSTDIGMISFVWKSVPPNSIQASAAWSDLGIEGGGMVNGKRYTKDECFAKALEISPKEGIYWTNLGDAGGGTVDGTSYTKDECYAKALEIDQKEQNV